MWCLAIGFSIVYYLLRVNFNLDVAGKVPTIRFAGVIVYSFLFLKIILFYKGINSLVENDKITIWDIIQGSIFIALLNITNNFTDLNSLSKMSYKEKVLLYRFMNSGVINTILNKRGFKYGQQRKSKFCMGFSLQM